MDPTIELRISISCMHVLDVYNIYIYAHTTASYATITIMLVSE